MTRFILRRAQNTTAILDPDSNVLYQDLASDEVGHHMKGTNTFV